jgi:hypothetical protein
MSERSVVIVGFAVVFAATFGAVAVSRLRRQQVATLGETLDRVTRSRTAKIIAVLIWAWLGWHFLAR